MYALASSGVGWAPAQISWQAQHFAACQGVGCTPWRRLASAGHRRRFRGRRSTLLLAKGSDVRPGVVWRRLASAGHRRRFRGRRSTLLLAKGSDVRPGIVWRRLASAGAPAQISWQAQHFAACQGVGCTPWRRLASAGHRRWQAQHFAACQGVGCTPWRRLASSGVGWAPAQISWQAQRFVNLHVQISWQAQHLWSWKLRTGDFVVQLQYAEYLRGWKMRTGDFVVQL